MEGSGIQRKTQVKEEQKETFVIATETETELNFCDFNQERFGKVALIRRTGASCQMSRSQIDLNLLFRTNPRSEPSFPSY